MKGIQFSFYIFAILLQFNCNSENDPFFKAIHPIIEVFHLLDDFLFACQGFFPAVEFSTLSWTLFLRNLWYFYLWPQNGHFNSMLFARFAGALVFVKGEIVFAKILRALSLDLHACYFNNCIFPDCSWLWIVSALGNSSECYCI